jgi:succinate-acetate transporter protein
MATYEERVPAAAARSDWWLPADPAPLGLAAFALTTFLLSGHNATFIPDIIWLGPALFYGGLAQLLAGMWEFRTGNTFGAVAFTSYGAFWISFWAFVVFYATKVPKSDATQAVGLYLFAWGLFTLYMWIASFRTTAAVNAVFFLLTITFFLLAFGEWGESSGLSKLGGWFGIATALVAWYASFAGVINSTFGKVVLPTKPLKA